MTQVIDISDTADWLHKPRAYSYIRFSTPAQEEGDSLRRQTEYSERVAEKLGLALDDSLRLTDRGLSAYKGDHRTKGALGGFLKLVEDHQIRPGSVLIIEALDRLSREGMLEAIHLLTGILLKGIDLYTAMDDKHFAKSTYDLADLIISATKLQQGHEESEKKSIRLGQAWKNKREEIANGHKITAKCPAWLKLSRDRKTFEVIPEAAQVVNWIFKMKLEGHGAERMEKTLNTTEGIWTPPAVRRNQRASWRKSYIVKILQSRAVIGEFTPHRKVNGKRIPEEPIENYYPAIVEKDLFNQVQALIQHNREAKGNAGGQNGTVSNLFGHLARCAHCHGPMAYVNKGEYAYLTCDTARRGLGCKRQSVRYDKVEPLILSYCIGLEPADILPGNGKAQSELAQLKNRLQAVEGELAQVQAGIERLLDNLELGGVVKDRLEARQRELTELEAQRGELAQQIAKLNGDGRETGRQLASIRELIDRMAQLKGYDRTDLRLNLRGHLRRLINEIEVWPDGLHVGIWFKTGEWRGLDVRDGQVVKVITE